jgi:hypothetical protein
MKLYQLSDRLQELEETIENLEGVDIPADVHLEYLELLAEAEETNEQFMNKIESILCLIQSRKRWLEMRKAEAERLNKLVKKDEKTIEWLTEYLKQHLEKIGVRKLRTNKFNLSVRKASVAPLHLLREDAKSYPQQYQKVTIEVDKKALKEAVINGDEEALKSAELGEKSTYLFIK